MGLNGEARNRIMNVVPVFSNIRIGLEEQALPCDIHVWDGTGTRSLADGFFGKSHLESQK